MTRFERARAAGSVAFLSLSVVATGCGGGTYASFPVGDVARFVEPNDSGARTREDSVRLRPVACESVDVRPERNPIDDESLTRFLGQRGYRVRRVRERADLVYLDVSPPSSELAAPLRLRVAILPSSHAAGRELHEALLQQGRGAWGVHRGNVAVLAPGADLDVVLGFVTASGMGCWGVLTVAGLDDTFVVPGGYLEL